MDGEQPYPLQRRMALAVEYDGGNYAGFQLQVQRPTIQGEIETALNRLTGEFIRLRAASRTDAGAHALGQVVDFLTASRHSADTFRQALNYYLPPDIRVQQAWEMTADFHSRRDASRRIYRYQILNRAQPPALRRREWAWIREPLTADRMNRAAQDLVGVHDFRPLALGHPPDKSAVRRVDSWTVDGNGAEVVIRCEGNGFLRQQIRRANAILVEIGKGHWPEDTLRRILAGESVPETAGKRPLLPAGGLCLVQVTYPDFGAKVKRV